MTEASISVLLLGLMAPAVAAAQQLANQSDSESTRITVRGCIRSERQSYILITNKTGIIYVLQGVGNKLQPFLRKEVEVTGETKPGSVKKREDRNPPGEGWQQPERHGARG